MTTLHDIFDVDEFNRLVSEGYIRVGAHPTSTDLRIANYAERCQFERMWTPETVASRGLIYRDDTLEIVARGFPKFFNWDDAGQPYPPQGPMVLSTKFDGSLGIMYREDPYGALKIATRGSFSSEQAIHATNRLIDMLFEHDEFYPDGSRTFFHGLLNRGLTPVFEILYPGNRIVVNYNELDTLVLLDVIDNKTGRSDLDTFDSIIWEHKADKRLIPGGFSDSLVHDIPDGEEGFVLYWPASGFRCKMKAASYIELHRIVTGLSAKSVWEALGRGETVEQIKENVPDELFSWVDEKATAMYEKAGAILDQADSDFATAYEDTIVSLGLDPYEAPTDIADIEPRFRGVFARHAASYPATRPYLFKILDGADDAVLWSMAWKTIRPVGDTRVWNQT